MKTYLAILVAVLYLTSVIAIPQSSHVTFTLGKHQRKCFKDDFVAGQVSQFTYSHFIIDS